VAKHKLYGTFAAYIASAAIAVSGFAKPSPLEAFIEEATQGISAKADQPFSNREYEVEYLGPGVLGMYVPSTDSIYIVRGLDSATHNYVLAHEREHQRRAYTGETQAEEAVDGATVRNIGYSIGRPYRN